MALLEARRLVKRFDRSGPPAVDGVDFDVEPGEIFGIVGPSGCGKTTLLRMIAGFEEPDGGYINLDGLCINCVPPERRRIGIVFQDYALFPHLSVLDNIIFALRHLPRRERQQRAERLLALVDLAGLGRRMPHELSGGQQQRVALARSMAAEPRLLLLDEPFSNLDEGLRKSTRADIRALLKECGMSAVLVTHDQEEVLSFSDRLAVMRAGRLEQVGVPESVYHWPRTAFVARFLGHSNILPGEARGDSAETALGRFPIWPPREGPVLLSLRPEHLTLVDASDSAESGGEPGCVLDRQFKGHDLTYRVRFGPQEVFVHNDYTSRFQPGAKVALHSREPAVVLEDPPETAPVPAAQPESQMPAAVRAEPESEPVKAGNGLTPRHRTADA